MSTLFWCSSPFTAAVVLWRLLMQPNNAPACGCSFWWYKRVSGTWTKEKNFNFLRFTKVLHLVLKWCSDVNEGNWIHFSFSSLCWWIDLSSWLEWVFSSLAQVSVGIFFVMHLLRKRLQSEAESDLTTKGLILDIYCCIMPPVVVNVKSASTTIFCTAHWCFSFVDMNSSRYLVWGVKCSVLYICPDFLNILFCKSVWSALSMQSIFNSFIYASSSLFLFQLVMKTFVDYFWKSFAPFSCSLFIDNPLQMFY